ncbi:hypothetical protein SFR_5927 [Streptomyces sp. FR-008]|nr:hypothetical protein SFR_5927 [Streptomyces sp. FR-008]
MPFDERMEKWKNYRSDHYHRAVRNTFRRHLCNAGIKEALRAMPHHMVITKPKIRASRPLTPCNVD